MADEIKIKAPSVEQNINVNVTGEAEIHRLYTELQAAQASLDRVNSTLQSTETELDRVRSQFDDFAHGNGIDILQEELERFKNTAEQSVDEFRAFLQSVNLNDAWGNNDWQFSDLFEQIKDGSITASQAILRVKTDYRALMEEAYQESGGMFDTQMVQGFTAALDHLGETIGIVVERLNSIEQNGVKAVGGSGGGDVANVLSQIENAARGMSEEVKGSYESITSLVNAMNEYANLDSTRILGVSQAFRNIADIGKGSYGTKSIENIVYLTKQLQALSSSGSSIRFDFTGFNDLKVSKASVSNLATYLPQIASVNVSKLEKLSQVNLTNFNNVKVSKSAIENISRLTEAIQVLKEVKAASVKADESSINITGGEREKQDTSHYKDATRAVKEYYAMLTQLGKAKSDVTLTSEGWKSESGQWDELAAALNRTKTAFDLYTNAENQSKMTDEERINFLRLLTSESEKYAISSEAQANKEVEAAEKAARKAEEKAEREKAAAEKAADAREAAAQRAADKEAASEAKRQEASKMSSEQIEANLLKIEKLSLSLNSAINNAEALGVDSEELDRLRALATELETLRANTASGSVTNQDFANSLRNIKLAADIAGASVKQDAEDIRSILVPGTTAYGTAQQELARKTTQAQNALRGFTAAEKSNNESSRTAYANIKREVDNYIDLAGKLERGELSQEDFTNAVKHSSGVVAENIRIIKANGDAHQTAGEKVQGAIAKFSQWFSVTRIVMAAYRTMKQMVSAVIEVDTAMTELRKVTEETEATYDKFLENATVRARNLGAALADTVNATADFARLGYTIEEAEQLSDAAIIYKNVGDGIEDISEASESIISTMKAFGIETQDALFVVDKFNEVGNNFAISSKGVGDALVRSASAMHAANNTLDETIALITTANTVVQNPDSVGTAMKTLSMYLRAAKTEAEEAGESTEGMADSVSELREELLSLTGGKVDIQIDEDTFKSTYQIIKELSEVWQDLSDVSQANILEMIGGKRNSNVVSALIENFELAERVMKTSAEAAGSATAENEKFLNSIQGHINQLKASFETFSQSFIDGDLVKFVVDVGTTILDLLNGITKVIDALGGLKTVLLAVTSVLLITKGELIGVKVQMLAVAAVKKLLTFFTNVKAGLLKVVNIIPTAITAWKGYAAGTVSASAAMQASIPVIGLVLAAITALVGALSLYSSKSDEAAQKSMEEAGAAAELSDDISGLTYEYLALSDAVATDESAKESLLDTQDKLLTKLSLEKDKIEELTKQYGSYTDAIKAASVEKLKDEERTMRGGLNDYEDALKTAAKGHSIADKSTNHLISSWSKSDAEANRKALQALVDAGYISSGSYGSRGTEIFLPTEGYDLSSVDGIVASYERLGKMLDIIADTSGSNIDVYKDFYAEYQRVTEALNQYDDAIGNLNTNLAEQYTLNNLIGKEIPTTKDAFDKYRQEVIDSAVASGEFIGSTNDIEAAVDGVLSQQSQFVGFYRDAAAEAANTGKATEETKATLSDLSESLQKLKSSYDILATAEKEMTSGGLTPETIKALADATDNYLDYLYEENGVIKLNTEAWKEQSNLEMQNNIRAIEDELAALEEQREALANAKVYEDDFIGAIEKGAYHESEYTAAVEANSAAIAENQTKLGLYSTLYNDITSSLDAYSAALANFTNISNAITSVSDSLTTVADLQETVANGFTLSLEKALEFAAVYPEILNGATVAADGQIALNEGIVNAFIEGKEAELHAQIDAKIAELESDKAILTAKKDFAQAELDLAKNVGEGEGQISQELAEYRVNAGNAVAQALIESGIDEATAYQLAMAAMAQNSEEFNRIAAQVCTDVDGNFNQAAYSAAQGIYNNMKNASSSLDGIIRAAHNAAAAIAGISSGTQAGSTGSFSGAGGSSSSGAKITLSNGTFQGVDYSYTPQTVSLDKFISDLELDISSYSKAISQIDGQIATLKALRSTSLNKFSTSYKKANSSGSGGKGSGSGSGSGEKEETWFEKQYKLHQHLLDMDAENVEDYLEWLNSAYQQAYNEGIIDLDDFYKYQEEVYKGLQDLFKDYLNDIEHEISMRENFEGENKKIIALYKELIAAVEKEIKAARAQGLDDTDDYIQELQKKWAGYKDSIKDIEEDVNENVKDAVDELIDIRIDMLKQDLKNEKDAIDKKLKYLKDFYSKQKEMLQDAYDTEKYLEEQSDKRKTIADIQAEIAQLEYDNSAWAQKRKLELAQELADAQKDLDDFEKNHALEAAQDELDKLLEMQEQELDAQTELLDAKENDAKALYEQALADIKNGSIQLYEEMIEWNNTYGDGISDTIKTAWEDAYKALQDYKDLYGSLYNGIDLDNATGYTKPKETWDTAPVSGTNPSNQNTGGNTKTETKPATSTPKATLTDAMKRKVAAAIWNGNYGWGTGTTRSNRLTEVFGANNGIQALVNQGVGKMDGAPGNDYTYLNMRKKFKGYASGTRKATAGMHSIDEFGTETIFESADGTRYKMFSGGEKVLNAKASDFLYEFANGGGEILEKIIKAALGGGIFDKIMPVVNNNEINMGDVVIQGSANEHTVSEIRRAQRDNLKNMLKEFNKLNK